VKRVVLPKVKDAIIHPFTFALFPVASLYVKNIGKGHLRDTVEITIGVSIFAALFWLFVNLCVRNKRESSVIVSVFFVLFFSYGHAISAVTAILERIHLLDKARFLVQGDPALLAWLAIWGILFVVASYFTLKSTSDLHQATQFLNVVGLTLMVMVGVNFITAGGINTFLIPGIREAAARADSGENATENLDRATTDEFVDSWKTNLSLENTNKVSDSLPDIYYVIVDAYARADILEEIYQFDNAEFLSYLAEKGFYVAHKSVTNYPQTSLSLASSLNLMYLDGLAAQMGTETNNRQPLQVMIKNSKVFQYLRNHGYSIFAFSSGYGATEIKDADMYMEPSKQWDLSEFQEALITLTPLSIFRKTLFDIRRDRIAYAFDHVANATRVYGPIFVFVHIQAPHWPFIFDADGKPIQPRKGIGMRADYEYDEFIKGYINQLIFVNRKLEIAIDEILSQSLEPVIIIVQSDHGPDAKLDYGGWKVEKTYLPERMSILNAYYFPDQDYETLYEDITPVNTFRIIFNSYFGTDYGLLEDRSYFTSWDHPYLFIDVTDDVLSGN